MPIGVYPHKKGYKRPQWVCDKISAGKMGKKQNPQHAAHTAAVARRNSRKYRGENHPLWRGDYASYGAIHMWILKKYGRARKCENRTCRYPRDNGWGKLLIRPKRYEYALIHGKRYGHNRRNFIQLCPSCHRKYDKNSHEKEKHQNKWLNKKW